MTTISCDVLIIGGGIAGLSLAAELAGRVRVVLAEAEPTLGYHTSGRSARQLVPSYGPPAVQQLTVRTLDLLHRRQSEAGLQILSHRSFLLIGSKAAVKEHASGQMEFIGPDDALELSPELRPGAFEAAGLDRTSFGCRTDVLLEHHQDTARAAGARFLTGSRVESARRHGSSWRVVAGGETIEAGTVVNAAGAWAEQVAALFGARPQGLVPYRRTAAVVDVARPLSPRQPMVAAADDSFYYRPENGQVLVSPSETEPSEPEDARPRDTDVRRAIAHISRSTTLTITGVAQAWTGLRTEPADGHPVVGFDPEVAGFFWLAGQGGYGFQTSAGIAELAAGLILGEHDGAGDVPAALSPHRRSFTR
ncbi:NAD(P)/FAD-dependent oxidoreductase [Arthrobacter sulfonylureivorans]|uniref:NAD(P)/FAD-dependent oxidoreductase n=1 Tax=Arthrobacter sulfonylureivorans TaxID=2486855 RepID=UPI0039E69E09